MFSPWKHVPTCPRQDPSDDWQLVKEEPRAALTDEVTEDRNSPGLSQAKPKLFLAFPHYLTKICRLKLN